MKKILYKMLYCLSIVGIKLFSIFNFIKPKEDRETMNEIENYKFSDFYSKDTFNDNPISKEQYDLSIIIPIYNSERYLDKCIKSIINQKTKYRYQVILVNDGSTDNSLKIINKYAKKNNNVFVYTEKNSGISVARNTGIRLSSGKYLGFIDNDDWVNENYVEKLLDRAYSKNADIVKCNHYNYSINDDCIISNVYHSDASIDKFGMEILNFKGYLWGGIVKKELFEKIRLPEGYWYEDIMMRFTLMRLANGYEHIEESLYYYALHKNNASKTLWKKTSLRTLEALHIFEYLMEFDIKNGIPLDEVLYNQLLFELGPSMWLKIYKMEKKYKRNLFICMARMAEKYRVGNTYWNYNKYIDKAFKTKNYLLWYITSANWIIKVHIGYVK